MYRLTTDRLILVTPDLQASASLLNYRELNRDHLAPWEPRREASFYTTKEMERRIAGMEKQMADETAWYWLLQLPGNPEIIGECNFTNIVHGPFQACHLGFSIGRDYQGRGLMRAALKGAIPYAFEKFKLHRIMANYQPDNHRSGNLLQSLGFEKEGLAKQYLKINGRWADHVLTSLINED